MPGSADYLPRVTHIATLPVRHC